MQEIDEFEQRLKEMSKILTKGSVREAQVLHKNLQKDVKNYLLKNQIEENDKLSQIQITIYNNLACISDKKGKYKSSLFHLQIAEKLESAYFAHKYNGKDIPPVALEQLSTTYSNLSAAQSKIGNIKEALNHIQFAVEVMEKSKELENHRGFVFLYYNYAILLETNVRYEDASKIALAGKEAARTHRQEKMVQKFDEILQRLKDHLVRQEFRKRKEMRKYLKRETGVVKKSDDLNLSSGETALENKEKMKDFLNDEVRNTASKDAARSKSYYNQKSNQYRSNAFPSYSKQKVKSISYNTLNATKLGKIKHNNTRSFNASHQTISDKKGSIEMMQVYGIGDRRRSKVVSLFNESPIDARIKERRRKLEYQIGKFDQKNEALEKIIEKLYLTEKKEKH